jgi:hypothetical protein
MRGLIVKPSQPNHGSFDRLGRTRQWMENQLVPVFCIGVVLAFVPMLRSS